jgi:hypothetical protein
LHIVISAIFSAQNYTNSPRCIRWFFKHERP